VSDYPEGDVEGKTNEATQPKRSARTESPKSTAKRSARTESPKRTAKRPARIGLAAPLKVSCFQYLGLLNKNVDSYLHVQ
jgi:hypothetical protein